MRPCTAETVTRLGTRRRPGVNVLSVDILGGGDEGGALLALCVALLEAVELDFVAEAVDETHVVGEWVWRFVCLFVCSDWYESL